MRRVLQLTGMTGLLVLGVPSMRAVAQEPAGDDSEHSTGTEQPTEAAPPAAMPPAPTAWAGATPNPATATRPKVGDVSMSGYFRGGFGASNQKGRMTCFALANPSGLVSKYRLGNECEVWSETQFTMVTYAGDDGVVANLHFMPTIYIPTTNIGYSPNGTVNSPLIFTTSTGATVSFPNLYVDIKGISWLAGGTPWVGTRYYKRESVYISDFFYWNPSGVGGGVEDINLGGDLRLSYAVFAVDGEPASPATGGTSPQLPLQTRLRLSQRSAASGHPVVRRRRAPTWRPVHRRLQQPPRSQHRRVRHPWWIRLHRPLGAQASRRRQQARRSIRQGRRNRLRNAGALLLPGLLSLSRTERGSCPLRRRAHDPTHRRARCASGRRLPARHQLSSVTQGQSTTWYSAGARVSVGDAASTSRCSVRRASTA